MRSKMSKNKRDDEKDGQMICDFTSFSTLFPSYRDDGWMIMKDC